MYQNDLIKHYIGRMEEGGHEQRSGTCNRPKFLSSGGGRHQLISRKEDLRKNSIVVYLKMFKQIIEVTSEMIESGVQGAGICRGKRVGSALLFFFLSLESYLPF